MEFPATELAVRNWLRTRPEILALLSGDSRLIDIDAPQTGKTFVTLYRAGGAPLSAVPLDVALLSFHCYGGTRKKALDLQTALIGVLNSMTSEKLTDGILGRGADVQSAYWLPDGPQARYVVTALVTASRSALAL